MAYHPTNRYTCDFSINYNAARVLHLEALDPRSCHVALHPRPRCHNGEHIYTYTGHFTEAGLLLSVSPFEFHDV